MSSSNKGVGEGIRGWDAGVKESDAERVEILNSGLRVEGGGSESERVEEGIMGSGREHKGVGACMCSSCRHMLTWSSLKEPSSPIS